VAKRLGWFARIVLLWVGAVFLRIIWVQVVRHQHYAGEALARQRIPREIPAPRGPIFDRMGQPLALSVPGKSVHVDPLKVADIASAAEYLSGILNLDRADLYAKMSQALARKRGDLLVARGITDQQLELIRKQPVNYIEVREVKERHYPNGSLLAPVLGSVDFAETGNAGIEKYLDAELKGIPGKEWEDTDGRGRLIDSRPAAPAHPGEAVTLTIDERLEYVAEREIAAAVEAHNAMSGSVVAMDPNTGDILAMASYPTYDPNFPPGPGENPAARQNHALSVPFEPGSVFKVITMSAALETTDLRPESPINCHGGVLQLPGRVIHDSHLGRGIIPMADVLAYSSNVGAIEVGLRVGQQNMYDYVRRFGFGQRTGVQLPAESPGRFRRLENWGTTSLASVAFGQEISVTTAQLAQAASVIANGGLLVKPRLVLKEGNQTHQAARPVRILKPDTAITMREMMQGVVTRGTGTKAQLPGYTTGGKTGSAQIYDYAAKAYTHTYNGSFMGFAPLMNARIVVVVTLNGTHGSAGFGGEAAAPVFKAVASEALRLMDVPKDMPEQPAKMFLAKNAPEDAPPVDSAERTFNPLDDEASDDGAMATAAAPGANAAASGPVAPNFRGMTLRAVMEQATAQGLQILPDGSGLAAAQDPPAGSPLRQGAQIRVEFAR
jgi:cell division protein FtsI (penicillin-binding protein 3)